MRRLLPVASPVAAVVAVAAILAVRAALTSGDDPPAPAPAPGTRFLELRAKEDSFVQPGAFLYLRRVHSLWPRPFRVLSAVALDSRGDAVRDSEAGMDVATDEVVPLPDALPSPVPFTVGAGGEAALLVRVEPDCSSGLHVVPSRVRLALDVDGHRVEQVLTLGADVTLVAVARDVCEEAASGPP